MFNTKKIFIALLPLLFCLLFFAQNAKAEIYTATNFQSVSCPYGSEVTAMSLTSPGDNVTIAGTGFGDRNITDSVNESVYIPNPTTGGVYNVYRGQRDEGGQIVYFGLMSWNDSEIGLEVKQGLGSSLGSYIILRTYSDINDSQGSCVQGTLTAGLICTSFTYSDWGTCQSDSTQTRTVLNSYPSGCSSGNPVLTQSCTPACTANDYSCNDWSSCSVSGDQTRTCNKISNCDGGVQMPETLQSCTYVPPICNSWTYSVWSDCQTDGTQTRTITNSSPDNCVGGNPVLTQNCNYIPFCTIDDYSCGDWSACSQGGNQTRACDKIKNCQDGAVSITTNQSCTYAPDCILFRYSSWSECSQDGKQTRSITSRYPSNCEGGVSSQTTQSCTPPCNADTWICGSWGECSLSGIQSRDCTKTFDCLNVQTASPITAQYCEPPSRPMSQTPPSGTDEILNQDTIIKSTVKLLCPVDNYRASQGSGTVIDSTGTILTNKHVIAGTLGCFVGFIDDFNDEPYFGDKHIADIIKISSTQDVAILKMRNPKNMRLSYVDTTKGSVNFTLGTKITTYGYPAKFGTKITYTSGDFSGTEGSYLKTTAILEYGNSGGGAYLKNGTFIGIPSAVVKGQLNAMGYLLSIDVIKAWLNDSTVASGNTNNNNYSRVSVLEDMDLNKLGSLELFIPDVDDKGNLSTSEKNKSLQNTEEQPQTNQTQKELTIIESDDLDEETDSKQNEENKKDDSDVEILEQRKSIVANAVQEITKIAEHHNEIGEEMKTTIQSQTQNQEKIETSIQKIKSRGGVTRFFIGPNYSEIKKSERILEQNKEQIQKLNEIRTQIIDQGEQLQIIEQIQALERVNEETETLLNETQKGFSLFGWMFRLFAK
ncbi:trypsin-like peptidase domain-containing protein [Patescibacteria group bacterium]|nr:trypsin-like peptidase domain-containing protein [Patescibacteria group bacterium]MBU2579808.1 trypsin-like peptidase domain-containing protein [Patescibacteria group bacterium]